MISLLLYGRNDAHGYNLHRRAALSLNCIAEVLTSDDDEIVFVDYNTPDELPTFIEALADTLTPRCIERLRVLRVPASLHQQRFAPRTHLRAVEPVCRNAAARRANPGNRWLLSTNTDMIFIPRSGDSLSDICSDLPDAYYGLPRFELPEWLWERIPRSEPRHVLAELERLGPRLHLDEPTLSNKWIRFDAPGDFQLCLRGDFISIDGFDEEMLQGWHVDSNFSRRIVLRRGAVESLEDDVAGYHCNHSRIPTIFHERLELANDLRRFFDSVDQAELPAQRDTWGLDGVRLQEVSIRIGAGVNFTEAMTSAIPPPERPKPPVRAIDASRGLTYDSLHVFPFIADSIAVSSPGITVLYVGCNSVLRDLLSSLAGELGLRLLSAPDRTSIDRVADSADLLVVDFGVDEARPGDAGPGVEDIAAANGFPEGMQSVLWAFQRLVALERDRLERGQHPRRFVLVQSTSPYTDAYVLSQLDCSNTPSTHSRVRRATVRLAAPKMTRDLWKAERLIRWESRLDDSPGRLQLTANRDVSLGDLEDFRGFGTGWVVPDHDAIWTQGMEAKLAIELDEARSDTAFLVLTFGRVELARTSQYESSCGSMECRLLAVDSGAVHAV